MMDLKLTTDDFVSASRSRELWRRIQQNDPTLAETEITLDLWSALPGALSTITSEEDMVQVGRDIGACTTLMRLRIQAIGREGAEGNFSPNRIKMVFDGISANRSLEYLHLTVYEESLNFCSEDEIIAAIQCLAPMLSRNNNLATFELWTSDDSGIWVPQEAVYEIATALNQRSRPLEKLDFQHCYLGFDSGVERLMLIDPEHCPRELDLRNNNIGREGWRAILETLFHPECNTEVLNLYDNSIGFQVHIDCPLKNGKPKPLEYLNLGGNAIDDDELNELLSLYKTHPDSTPKILHLHENNIKHEGCTVIAELLKHSSCPLEILDLRENIFLDDDAVMVIINALRDNNNLKQLCIGGDGTSIIGWNALTSLLCDTTTIEATRASNHTLLSLGEFEGGTDHIPDILLRYLEMNEQPNKKMVYRQKILMHHFVGDYSMEHFNEMGPALLLRVVGFVDRAIEESSDPDDSGNARISLIFKMLRNNPLWWCK